MILMYAGQTLTCKLYSINYPGDPGAASPIFSVVSGFSVSLITLALIGFSFSPSPMTILLGVANAAALIGYNYFFVAASRTGPYSILMTLSVIGAITVPSFVGVFAFGEGLTAIQYISLAVIVVSIYFVCRKKGAEQRPTKAFFLYCFGVFACNGAYNALMNVQQELTGAENKEEMVIITFFLTGVVSALILLIQKKKNFFAAFGQTKLSLTFLLVCSTVAAVAVNLLTVVLPLLDTAIFFSFKNSGILVFSIIGSFIIFKEKISLTNIIGALFMCAGLVCMSAF